MFFCKFCNILKNIFSLTKHLRMTASCVYLWIMRRFSEHFFYRTPRGNCYFIYKLYDFNHLQPTSDTVKNYFTGAFQAFYTRSRGYHSKVFIYLKSLKTVSVEVNLLWSCEMPTRKLTQKNSITHPPSCISPSFSQNTSQLLLPTRLWKFDGIISFWKCKRKIVLLVIYLFIQANFFHVELWHLTFSWGFSWVRSLSNKLEFFVSCNNIRRYYKDFKNILLFAVRFDIYFFIKK